MPGAESEALVVSALRPRSPNLFRSLVQIVSAARKDQFRIIREDVAEVLLVGPLPFADAAVCTQHRERRVQQGDAYCRRTGADQIADYQRPGVCRCEAACYLEIRAGRSIQREMIYRRSAAGHMDLHLGPLSLPYHAEGGRQAEAQASWLVRDIQTLTQWLHHDVLALAGLGLATRQTVHVRRQRVRAPQPMGVMTASGHPYWLSPLDLGSLQPRQA